MGSEASSETSVLVFLISTQRNPERFFPARISQSNYSPFTFEAHVKFFALRYTGFQSGPIKSNRISARLGSSPTLSATTCTFSDVSESQFEMPCRNKNPISNIGQK